MFHLVLAAAFCLGGPHHHTHHRHHHHHHVAGPQVGAPVIQHRGGPLTTVCVVNGVVTESCGR